MFILLLILSAAVRPAFAAPEPFAFADFTWLNGNSRLKEPIVDGKYFTGQFMVDANYVYDFNRPKDHTVDGSSEIGRAGEVQLQQLGLGGDLHYDQVRGRVMTQLGMYAEETPRNDASVARGQWNLADAYRYLSEAYGGYHWDAWDGINLDAGLFMSYVGLFSYYNNENWAYQPSYVSANTPWYFNGLRLQTFPTDKLKIEFWLVNGWQSYGMSNETPGFGTQVLYRPNGSVSLLTNDYFGFDTPGMPGRSRLHTDNSVEVKYLDRPASGITKGAFSLTFDFGCESGNGVSCTGRGAVPGQYFLGAMAYNRLWFNHDQMAITLGGGVMNNPGRYLALVPPINGATAVTGASPYFTQNPGDPLSAWDASATFDYMPKGYLTWRLEFNHRVSAQNYFVGPGGITPPGGNTASPPAGWMPDLVKHEERVTAALLIRL